MEVPEGHGVDVADLDHPGDVDRDVETALGIDHVVDEGRDGGGVARVADVGHEPRALLSRVARCHVVGGPGQLVLVASAAVDDEAPGDQVLGHEQPQPS